MNGDVLTVIGTTHTLKAVGYAAMYYANSPTNCKMGRLDNIGGLASPTKKTAEANRRLFDAILQYQSRVIVICDTPHEKAAAYLKKKYDVLSCVKIPIGYNGKSQYHIIINNPYGTNNKRDYDNRIKREGISAVLHGDNVEPKGPFTLEDAFRAGRKDTTYHATVGFKKFINKQK